MSEPILATDVNEPAGPDKKKPRVTRRQFLIMAGAGGAAALVGLRALGLPYARLRIAEYLDSSGGPPVGIDAPPTAWFEILPDNRVRLFLPKVEMGQGVHTALAQAAADELEAAWENLEVLSAATGQGLDDPVGTSASNSVSSLYPILRQAGATVRQMLRTEGARQLNRPVEDTAAEQGFVYVSADPTVRRSYGEIVGAAETLTVPEQPAPLKADSELRYIGRPMPRVDLRAKVLGQAVYGIDVRLPGMAYGAVAHPPTVEGKLERASAGQAESMPGVVKVVIDLKTGFAGVVAESREQAYAALSALDLTWDAGHLWQQAEIEAAVTAGGAGGVVIQDEGAVRGRLRTGAAVEAEYRVPMAYHAHFEPMTAVAEVGAGGARIYTSTQAAVSVRSDVAEALGLEPESVVVNQPYLGAGLGHKVETKAAVEAARLSQAAGRPVHVVWSRAEDFRNSFVRPPTHHILRASLTADGRIEALVHEQASGKVALPFLPAIAGAVLGHDFGAWRGARISYGIPNLETIAWVADLPFLTGWWRGLGLLPNTFAVECFMDEVAVAAGADPIDLRLRHLPDGLIGERLRTVLLTLADRAGWNTPAPAGRARGVACCLDYGTVVANVAEVSVEGGQIRVHRVTSVVDPGVVVNPDGVEAQVEGNVIMGVSSALLEETTIADGVLSPANFGAYRILSMSAAPEIEVALLQGDVRPSGIGEPPIGPVAPAIANAVYALTGQRLRRLPLRLDAAA
jgi:isoquinoline 1-oxidoreductase beta subunit